jgi:hypothetical protein
MATEIENLKVTGSQLKTSQKYQFKQKIILLLPWQQHSTP